MHFFFFFAPSGFPCTHYAFLGLRTLDWQDSHWIGNRQEGSTAARQPGSLAVDRVSCDFSLAAHAWLHFNQNQILHQAEGGAGPARTCAHPLAFVVRPRHSDCQDIASRGLITHVYFPARTRNHNRNRNWKRSRSRTWSGHRSHHQYAGCGLEMYNMITCKSPECAGNYGCMAARRGRGHFKGIERERQKGWHLY